MDARPPEEWCWQTLRSLRWPAKVVCPYCSTNLVNRHRQCGQAYHYRCRGCRRIFSDLTATPFEGTRLPLAVWFSAICFLVLAGGLTARSLIEGFAVNRKTGRMMKNRLWALRDDPFVHSIGAMVLTRQLRSQSEPKENQAGGR